MSHFDLLQKRHHVRRYADEIPPRYVVEHALCKHGKQRLSKNNAMTYKVIVYGFEQVEKEKNNTCNTYTTTMMTMNIEQ